MCVICMFCNLNKNNTFLAVQDKSSEEHQKNKKIGQCRVFFNSLQFINFTLFSPFFSCPPPSLLPSSPPPPLPSPAMQFIQLHSSPEEKSLSVSLLSQLEAATHSLISTASLSQSVNIILCIKILYCVLKYCVLKYCVVC